MAIFKATTAVGGVAFTISERLTEQVVAIAEERYPNGIAEVDEPQDIVENTVQRNDQKRLRLCQMY